ncbi:MULTISPECIES: acyl-CoA carboxylase subunit epsilon [Gordonia]|uniref:acyl-CoA carboxylase subunit epsilon n=1 Tax=Gordonia TaxID=2053 RepID=UPI003265E208
MSADVTSAAGDEQPARPFLTVVSGNPTDEDVAVLVSVLAAAGGEHAPEPGPRNDWGRPVDMFRQTWGQPGSFTNRGGW